LHVSRASLVLPVVLAFAIASTVLLAVHLAVPLAGQPEMGPATQSSVSSLGTSFSGGTASGPASLPSTAQPTFQFLLANSPALSTASWALVGGVWIWRGRMKSRWEGLGFDSGIFDLFMKMKGAQTRLNLLDALSGPKDRLQLAQQLGLDWKAVDYHIILLNRYGLVHEDQAYGNVKMYTLTKQGEILLQLLKEFNRGVAQPTQSVAAGVPSTLPR
jgi:DNA-binding transcriptional ArsR family regulator